MAVVARAVARAVVVVESVVKSEKRDEEEKRKGTNMRETEMRTNIIDVIKKTTMVTMTREIVRESIVTRVKKRIKMTIDLFEI